MEMSLTSKLGLDEWSASDNFDVASYIGFKFMNQRADKQQTLAKPIELSGINLHNGEAVKLRLSPAEANHGIKFLRSDLKNGSRIITPKANMVTETSMCTSLANEHDGLVSTIEHLMAAFHATGISNCLVEVNGPELPILDGSAAPYVSGICNAGLVNQGIKQKFIRVLKPIKVGDYQRSAQLSPHVNSDDVRLTVDFSIEFEATCIRAQNFYLDVTPSTFEQEISAARTFGFVEHLDALLSQGKAKGASQTNAIVIKNGVVQNPGGLRYSDEFVRHKALDAVGDLYIEGLPLIGVYKGVRAGHDVTNRLMRKLISDPSNYELTEI